jgi:plasmid stability protein
MAQLLVRNLDDSVKEALRRRALCHGRSMEEEARLIRPRPFLWCKTRGTNAPRYSTLNPGE